ncbi:MAG TPA: hypothetical protein VF221_04145 [Chloroflexota bacterium]
MMYDELTTFITDRMSDGSDHQREPQRLSGRDDPSLLGPDGHARWMSILDDRSPGSDGPISFEGPLFAEVLGCTTMVVLDCAIEPDKDVYDLLSRAVTIGKRVLVIQTTVARRATWRGFLEGHWPGGQLGEIVPVENCSVVRGR